MPRGTGEQEGGAHGEDYGYAHLPTNLLYPDLIYRNSSTVFFSTKQELYYMIDGYINTLQTL
jgi:hypothetical protein